MIWINTLDIDPSIRNWPGTVIVSSRDSEVEFTHHRFLVWFC